MARITTNELERLKQEVSLQRLVEARGIELRKHGATDLIGCCPFHDDKTPSLVISAKKNLWHCLGACAAGGSVIDWVMKAEGVSFRHAVELLRADAGLSGELPKGREGRKVAKTSTTVKLAAPVALGANDAKLLRDVVGYYHATLAESPEALGYLESRGLKSAEFVEHFQLGFANRTLAYRLPQKNRAVGAELRGRLQALGILRASGHEHFNGSIVVPIFDEHGAVVEMYGRKITSGLRKGTPDHLYLPGPHRGVWNLAALAADEHIILCESLFDAMTFWCAGYRNVTCSYGVGGFTGEHLAAFKQHGIKRVSIAYDRDDAGEAAAEKLAARLVGEGLDVYRVQFPKGMDANEYALKMQPADKALGLAIRQAVWMVAHRPAGVTPPPPEPTTLSNAVATNEDAVSEPALVCEVNEAREPVFSLAAPTPPEPATSTPATVSPTPGGAEPAAPAVDMQAAEHEIVFRFGDRRVRVRGLDKNKSYDVLKVNLLVGRGEAFFVDTVDLYNARQRALYVQQAADELGVRAEVIKSDLGRVLLALEEKQEQTITAAAAPKTPVVVLSETDRTEALSLLKDPRLCQRILADFAHCGVVGEQINKLVGYLAATSRKLAEPLAVIVQSSSAAGKSALMDAVLSFVPEEERVKYSAMTGQSLFYLGETELSHKILAIVEEEGAERASYALKLLQSEGELTIASTGKDPQTGKLITNKYRVEGPVMIFLTTTAIEIDEELLNRCLVLTVDEGAEQTRAIHERQRQSRTLEGLLGRRYKDAIVRVHQNAQRLLRPLPVVNPFAGQLTFAANKTRMRRDHMKYLTLIETIALLHQHQRPVKTVMHGGERVEYIEVVASDIELANRLAHQVLGRTLDELPPQTRRLLGLLDEMVTTACAAHELGRGDFFFSRRQVREYTGWSYEQTRVHLSRLVDLEYLIVHRGARGQTFVYELCYEGRQDDGTCRLAGLIDVSTLGGDASTTSTLGGRSPTLGGQDGDFGVPYRGHTGPKPGGSGDAETAPFAKPQTTLRPIPNPPAKNAYKGGAEKAPSYVPVSVVAVAPAQA